jgi:hypothetical protein
VPPAQLAFWLVDNWWRLRWESVISGRVSHEWRLAHDLSSIGGGYVWPCLSIWGEGVRTGLSCSSDPPGVVGPVRYVTDALTFVPAAAFERGVDDFLRFAVDAPATDREALRAHYDALVRERGDAEMAAWRRLEAQLGFDPDDAPDALMQTLSDLADRYGAGGVEEAALAAQGEGAARTLEEIEAAQHSRFACQLEDAVAAAGRISKTPQADPWVVAERAALRVRNALGVDPGPLRNKKLSEVLKTGADAFRSTGADSNLAYGLRLKTKGHRSDSIALQTKWSHDRRFELCRALGDAVWSRNEVLGPITSARSARQKFQRAFAQTLLCPFDDLVGYIGTETRRMAMFPRPRGIFTFRIA